MQIEKIEVTKENLMDILMDEQVFVISHEHLWNRYGMRPVKEATVADILSSENAVIRITD